MISDQIEARRVKTFFYGDISTKFWEKRKETENLATTTPTLIQTWCDWEKDLYNHYIQLLLAIEVSFYRQNSRTWIQERDFNTKVFSKNFQQSAIRASLNCCSM